MAGLRKNKEDSVSLGQLLLWQSRGISSAIGMLIFGFLMIYATDTLKIAPAVVSLILVLSKVVDGFTDLVAGFIVDKTKTRWGKGRPYEIFIVGLWLCTWLMFTCPVGFSTPLKCVWIFLMYTLANSICYTFLNANAAPYTVRVFKSTQIVKVTSYGSIIPMLAAVIFNIVFPTMMGSIATSPAGWSRLVGMWAVPMAAIGLLRMIFVPEKYDVDVAENKQEKLQIRHILTLVKTNKFILIVAAMTFVFNFVCNMGVGVYYFTYIVKNVGMMGITSLAAIVSLPMAFFFPKLISKFSTVKLMMAGFLISAAGYLINFFAGASIALLAVGGLLTGVGTVPASMLSVLLILDCADYNEWTGHHRMEGTMSSLNGFASKVGAAIGAGILGVLLSIVGFTGDVNTTSQGAIMLIRVLYSLVPMALYLLTALSLKNYKLDALMPQIKAENEANRTSLS